jgi:hypothetical protein
MEASDNLVFHPIAGMRAGSGVLDGRHGSGRPKSRHVPPLGPISTPKAATTFVRLRWPSRDLGELVMQTLDRLPYLLRHLFRGLGATGKSGWDLLSYLAFDSEYTSRLLALGYSDVKAWGAQIATFLGASDTESRLPGH